MPILAIVYEHKHHPTFPALKNWSVELHVKDHTNELIAWGWILDGIVDWLVEEFN